MSRAWIALGANLGDGVATLSSALLDLDRLPGTRVSAQSRFYRSTAVGPGAQPDYVNAVARLETTLEPHALLDELQAIEARHGRVRDGTRWGPRTLDLDLLLYDERVIRDQRLTLPHAQITRRNFVLAPLLELDPELSIPGAGPARAALEHIGMAGLAPLAGTVANGTGSDED